MPAKLTNVKVAEVSFCRKGMNQHARVALFKSADPAPQGPQAIAKATFQEALEGNMTAAAVNDAFYASFDGLWERNDAFRTALTDELAAGGDGSAASDAYVASVKALVDTAVEEARTAGATASDTSTIDKSLSAAVEKWLESKEHPVMNITSRAALATAVSAFAIGKSTVEDLLAIQKAATDLNAEDLLPADGPLAKAKPDPQLAKMQREVAVLKLAPETKSHFDTLDEAGQTAFLGKSADEQKADIEKANASDPVVYTTKDGTAIRKSDGGAVLAMAKSNDDLRARLEKAEGKAGDTAIDLEAGQYANVAKATAVSMLKTADRLGRDSDEGKDVLKSLETMNKGASRFMKSIGSDEGGDRGRGDDGSLAKARTDFNAAVEKIKARDKCDGAAAMSKARTEEPELFAEAYPETVAAAEEAEENAARLAG